MVAPSAVMLCCAQYAPPAKRPPIDVGIVVKVDHCLRRLRKARYSLQVIGSLPFEVELSASDADEDAKRRAEAKGAAGRARAKVRAD